MHRLASSMMLSSILFMVAMPSLYPKKKPKEKRNMRPITLNIANIISMLSLLPFAVTAKTVGLPDFSANLTYISLFLWYTVVSEIEVLAILTPYH